MPSVHPKRQRTDAPATTLTKAARPTHSRILAPFRAAGHITAATPFSLLPLGKTFQVTTALTHTVQTYDIRKLNLLFVSSPETPGIIRRVVAHRDVVYAAFEDPTVGVWIFKRGKKVGELQDTGNRWSTWRDLLVFGEWVVGAFARGLAVWRRETGELYTEIEMADASGELTAVCHPSTYLNKLVVARRNGDLDIWNVKTGKSIYTILSPLDAASIKSTSAVTVLLQTPVINVVAAGYSTGQIHLHNILTDKPLFSLNAPTGAAVPHPKRITSLSFCTDPMVGAGKTTKAEGGGRVLAVGHDDGDVSLWNLEKRTVVGIMRNAHSGSSNGVAVEWLAGQNLLMTTGGDNSVKEWVFDSTYTTLPRLLRSRAGHSQPITALVFASPANSHFVLSSSMDQSLRAQSLRNDSQSFEFSQGLAVKKANKAAKNVQDPAIDPSTAKAGPITCITTCAGEDGAGSTGREWEGIITGHAGERAARVWNFQNKKIGRWILDTHDGGEVKSVAITACGTFGLVGSSGGGIDMYNLQSGQHRRRFPQPLTQQQARLVRSGKAAGSVAMLGKGRHTKAVTGILTDALNRTVISTGLDGKIKFWEFITGILVHEISWTGSDRGAITKAKLYRASDLLAVACDDLCIRVVDTETRKIVRELWGCTGRISDFVFSHDGRWLIAASMDSVIRIWDLPTGHLIDAVKTKSVVTALAFAGTGEFLATAHVDSVGINLWTNRTLFRHVAMRHLEEDDIVDLMTPTVSGEGGTGVLEGAFSSSEDEKITSGTYVTKERLSESLLTLSMVPKSRWQTLLNLEVIRQRNKPKEAPKPPEKAPFFLPSLGAAADGFAPETNTALVTITAGSNAPASRLTRLDAAAASALGSDTFSALLFPESPTYLSLPAPTSTSASTTTLAITSAPAPSTTNGSSATEPSTAEPFTTTTTPDVTMTDAPALAPTSTNINTDGTNIDLSPAIEHLKTLPPARADLEIRSLRVAEMSRFIDALTQRLVRRQDFELVLTWTNVFLKAHAELVKAGEVEGLADALRRWRDAMDVERERLARRVGYCNGVVKFLRSSW